MARQAALCFLTLTFILCCNFKAISASQSCWDVPFRISAGWILVKARIGGLDGLTFQIDTGSTCSLIDRKIVRKLGLTPEPGEYRLNAYGQIGNAKKVELSALQMGRISTRLRCFEADLSMWSVDGLIGLDVLRHMNQIVNIDTGEAPARKTLTLDFGPRCLRFGESVKLDHAVPLEADPTQIVVAAEIQGHSLRLALDTGSRISVLYAGAQRDWIHGLPIIGYWEGSRLLGRYQQKEVRIQNFILGTTRCDDMSALVSDAQNHPIDGLLSVVQLGPKILHLDFDCNLMSWK